MVLSLDGNAAVSTSGSLTSWKTIPGLEQAVIVKAKSSEDALTIVAIVIDRDMLSETNTINITVPITISRYVVIITGQSGPT